MNIVIVGMRGAGKSNVSRRLSVLTKRPVFSTDTMAEYEEGGKTIADIVNDSGGDWRAFRDLEYRILQKIARIDGVIVDCGGGIVVDLDDVGREIFSERKINLLKRSGPIVWLKGDIERLVNKVETSAARPGFGELREVEAMMRRREPFYEQAADLAIDIEGGRPRAEIAEEIFETQSRSLTFRDDWFRRSGRHRRSGRRSERRRDVEIESVSFDVLHRRIVRPAAAFRRDPIDVLSWVLDVAGFAVYTVLAVDPQNFTAGFLVVEILVNAGGTEALFRTRIARPVDFNRNVRVLQRQVAGLVFPVIGIGDEDARKFIEGDRPVRLQVVDGSAFGGFFSPP